MEKISLSLVFVILFALSSCYEDKGNYDYVESNDVTVTLRPTSAVGYLGERYVYYPEIEFSDETDTTNFEYWWEFTGTSSEAGYDTICLGRELNFVPDVLGRYNTRLCVKELATGVITTAKLQLRIQSPYGKGWTILTEKEGRSSLSFVRPGYDLEDKRIYTPYVDVYAQLHPEDVLGQNPYRLKQVMNSEECMILLMQNNDPIYLDGGSLEKMMTMDKEFVGEAYPENLVIKDFFYGTGQDAVLSEDGSLYTRNYMQQGEYQPFFSCAFANVPVEFGGKRLDVESICYTMPSQAQFFGLHDAKEKRLLWAITGGSDQGAILGSNMISGADPTQEFIDLNNFGDYDLLFAGTLEENNQDGNGNASLVTLFKNDLGIKMQQQKATLVWSPTALDISEIELKNFSGENYISEDTKYLLLSTRPYLFFSTEGVIYWYDLIAGITKDFYVLPQGVEVVKMDGNPQESELGVLLDNGTFIILNIENEMLYSSEKIYELNDLGIGIDLMYKYPNWIDYLFRNSYSD